MKEKLKTVTQLKTAQDNERAEYKKIMLEYLGDLLKRVENDEIETIVSIVADHEKVSPEVIGEANTMEIVGMLDTAKLSYQFVTLEADL